MSLQVTDFLLKWELWMILFSAEAILASSTSKFGIENHRVDDEDLKSSTESIANKYIPRYWTLSSNKQRLLV